MIFELAEEEQITIFGTNAKYLAAIEKEGLRPGKEFNLKEIKTVLSTGSPLLPESFDFVYRDIGKNICLSSISGGTDILGCFALGSKALPVYRGELQCRSLGLNVQVFNDKGESVLGEKGELVCTAPFPSMPTLFWNDPGGKRYHEAYFSRFKNIWHHGDYVELTERGTMVFHGRSDAVLNPGGVRIGTAEIYNQVERIPEITDCAAVGQKWLGDERVVLFITLCQNTLLNDELKTRIKTIIKNNASPFHVPKKIIAVKDIPRTRSGKNSEYAIQKTINGEKIANLEALANPESLDYFHNLEELQE